VFWFVPVPYTRIVNPWKVIRFAAAAMKSCPCGISDLREPLASLGPRANKTDMPRVRQNETRPSGKLGRAGTEDLKKKFEAKLWG
jgi:hypothetical protein